MLGGVGGGATLFAMCVSLFGQPDHLRIVRCRLSGVQVCLFI